MSSKPLDYDLTRDINRRLARGIPKDNMHGVAIIRKKCTRCLKHKQVFGGSYDGKGKAKQFICADCKCTRSK